MLNCRSSLVIHSSFVIRNSSFEFPLSFQFLDPGPLIDRELELVAPHERWVEDVLHVCGHPLTLRDAPKEASNTTRGYLTDFLRMAPLGREPADPHRGRVPSYHFWMYVNDDG